MKVCRRTVELCRQQNLLQFAERFQQAHEDFCDSQEEIVYKLNKELKPGQTPLSVLATLNANRPAKWRPNVQVTHDLGQRVMSALQAAQQRDRDEAAEINTVVGEMRELPQGSALLAFPRQLKIPVIVKIPACPFRIIRPLGN